MGFVRKLRSTALGACVTGLGPAACLADPMVPCEAFEPGDAAANTLVRSLEGPIAAVAMKDAFLLRNVCDGPGGECRVDQVMLPELSPGSQVMLTTSGRFLVGIDHDGGDVWTYTLEGTAIARSLTYVDDRGGPAQLVIGLRDSDRLVVRDHEDRLAVYEPGDQRARPLAAGLGAYLRLAAVGERHVAVKVPHGDGSQSLYVVDVDEPDRWHAVVTGDLTSVVIGPRDATLVVSEGRGADASVLVFDVGSGQLADAFSGELVSSREQNDHRALEELPGLHAIAPGGDALAYRTTAGSLAVRSLSEGSSCLVRNTNRLGTGDDGGSRRAGNHAVAGFAADGLLFAEYQIDASESFVYAYDPRHQQIVPLGREDGGWHLAAVPGRSTDGEHEPAHLWAVGVRQGYHASIGEDRVDGQSVGEELTFMPMDDDGVWAVDTKDEIVGERRTERALSVRRVAPPAWAQGRLRFEQGPDEQIVTHYRGPDNEGPLRVPLTGRLCLTTGAPGSWAYRCGDSTGGRDAITTNSGRQEQTNDPNVRPEFDPPFPDQGEGDDGGDEPGEKDDGPRRG